MKTITIFSEKGGVGKSSISILYASWLKYKCGVKVGIADFNRRIESYRQNEIKEKTRQMAVDPEAKPYDMSNIWPIETITAKDINTYKKNGSQVPYATWLNDKITEGGLCDMDVVLCDFPGSFDLGYKDVMNYKLLNVVAIPIEMEQFSLMSTLKVNYVNGQVGQYTVGFINKAKMNLSNIAKKYYKYAEDIKSKGVLMLPDIVVASDKMSTIEKADVMRSTFFYPDFKQEDLGGTGDLGLENLFIDLTKELNKKPDIKDTNPTNLDFVNRISKNSFGRKIKASSFPEYEKK